MSKKKTIKEDREPHTGTKLYAKKFRASAAELNASEAAAKRLEQSWNDFARDALRNWIAYRKETVK